MYSKYFLLISMLALSSFNGLTKPSMRPIGAAISYKNRTTISWTPTALIPLVQRQECRLGLEYGVSDKLSIGLDGGAVFAANKCGGNGFALHPQVRYYLVNYRVIRWFTGAEGLTAARKAALQVAAGMLQTPPMTTSKMVPG